MLQPIDRIAKAIISPKDFALDDKTWRSNKNDAADAEAICEAVRRPTMRLVQVKSAEQQGSVSSRIPMAVQQRYLFL